MNRLTKIRYWMPITAIGIFSITAFALMAFFSNMEPTVKEQKDTYIVPTGIEALDLNINAVKVIVTNQNKIPLLDESSDYAYDGFIARDNRTDLDVIFTLYDKTNSTLTKIPGIKHGQEFVKILNDFIIHVDTDNKLGVYTRK